MKKKTTKEPQVLGKQTSIENCVVVHFCSLKGNEGFCLKMSNKHSYDDVVERVARRINVGDPSKIRLFSHNCLTQQPKTRPIKYRGVENLSDMLIDRSRVHFFILNCTSDTLYYEVFDVYFSELNGLQNLEVAFHHATKDEVVIHNIKLPKKSMAEDVIKELKTKVQLSHPNAELRLLKNFCNKICQIFPSNENMQEVNPPGWTLRAEEILEEEKNLGPYDRLIRVYHFTKVSTKNQEQRTHNFGEPFLFLVHIGETLAEFKLRIQKKLPVPDEDFAKWKFAFKPWGCSPEYLQDADVVSTRYPKTSFYDGVLILGLEHSVNAPKRSYKVNKVAVSTKIPEKRPPSTPGNESSRKKHKHESSHSPRGELENHASHITESDSRIEDNEIKGPALQPSIAGICSEEDRNKTKADDKFAAEHQMSSDNETTIKQEKIDSCEGQAAGAYHVPDISKGQRKGARDVWEQYLGLEHFDKSFKRSYVVTEQEAAATSDPKNRPSNMPENEASTMKRKPESEHCLGRKLEKHASHVVEFDTRIQDNHAKDPALEPIIARMCSEQDQEKTKTDAIRVNDTICTVLEPSTAQIIGEQEQEKVNSEATDGTLAEQQMNNNLDETINGKTAISLGKINSREVQAKISEGQVSSESTESCFDKMATQMLEMLEDEKDPDSLRLADFNDIASNRHVDVGIFTVPESLHAYAKHLLATHPDVGTGNSPVHYINEMAFIVLCCTLKSMSTTPLAELTKSLIFKWRDAIRGTLQCGFKVDFLKEHLKFVAQAYLGKVARNSDESKESQAIFDKITTMEKQLELLKASHSEMSKKMNTELRKTCETAAAKFPGATLDFCFI